VQEILGKINPGEVDIFVLSGLKQGQTLFVMLQTTSGNRLAGSDRPSASPAEWTQAGKSRTYPPGHVQGRSQRGRVPVTPHERPFRIAYAEAAVRHLSALTARQRATVLDVVALKLTHQPTVPTRSRKRLRDNTLAPWELRIGDIRVYFDVEEAPEAVATIRAVGVKTRERVMIGGEEVDLT
jgi:mRNA-degrading endonuclease RelE of RelBE toxin-antitoxin system